MISLHKPEKILTLSTPHPCLISRREKQSVRDNPLGKHLRPERNLTMIHPSLMRENRLKHTLAVFLKKS